MYVVRYICKRSEKKKNVIFFLVMKNMLWKYLSHALLCCHGQLIYKHQKVFFQIILIKSKRLVILDFFFPRLKYNLFIWNSYLEFGASVSEREHGFQFHTAHIFIGNLFSFFFFRSIRIISIRYKRVYEITMVTGHEICSRVRAIFFRSTYTITASKNFIEK